MLAIQSFFFLSGLLVIVRAIAIPAPRRLVPIRRQGDVSTLSSTQLSDLAPFTQFARAAYCGSSKVQNWQCGQACDALPGFKPSLVGGDGNAEQFFFVGFMPSQSSVIVAHEGTDPTKLMSDLTDINIATTSLNSTLFPGAPSDITVHKGFSDEHGLTGGQILAEVNKQLTVNNAKQVTLIGHSLGGALAELDTLMMKMNLPSDVTVKGVTYGTPRVGNDKFAAFFDSKVDGAFQRVNNEKDIVPIVPGRFLGFSHPSGEIHITSPGNAISCPGDDDSTDNQCTINTVPNIIDGDVLNHLGPYEGISIGTLSCDP